MKWFCDGYICPLTLIFERCQFKLNDEDGFMAMSMLVNLHFTRTALLLRRYHTRSLQFKE